MKVPAGNRLAGHVPRRLPLVSCCLFLFPGLHQPRLTAAAAVVVPSKQDPPPPAALLMQPEKQPDSLDVNAYAEQMKGMMGPESAIDTALTPSTGINNHRASFPRHAAAGSRRLQKPLASGLMKQKAPLTRHKAVAATTPAMTAAVEPTVAVASAELDVKQEGLLERKCELWPNISYVGDIISVDTLTGHAKDMQGKCCQACQKSKSCRHWTLRLDEAGAGFCALKRDAIRWTSREPCENESCVSGAAIQCQKPADLGNFESRLSEQQQQDDLPLLIFLVPLSGSKREYKDRFLTRLSSIASFQKFVPLVVFAELVGTTPFNIGQLRNIAFKEATLLERLEMKTIGGTFDASNSTASYVFHDIDNWAERPWALNYAQCFDNSIKQPIRRVYGIGNNQKLTYASVRDNSYTLGGIFCISASVYEKLNGFVSNYWGWGVEDKDFALRLVHNQIEVFDDKMVYRPSNFYRMGNAEGESCGIHDPPMATRWKEPYFKQNKADLHEKKLWGTWANRTDGGFGLNGLSDLNYTVLSRRISDAHYDEREGILVAGSLHVTVTMYPPANCGIGC